APAYNHERGDNFVFARSGEADGRRVYVGLPVCREILDAPVSMARSFRGLRIDFSQVTEDRLYRAVQTVQIETVEADACVALARAVVIVQPLEEPDDVRVAPHPARESRAIGERRIGRRVSARVAHPAIHAIRIRPVR